MVSGGQSLGTAVLDLTVDSKALDQGLSNAERGTKRWGIGVAAAAAAATAAIAAVGVGLFKIGQTFDNAYGIIIKQTGATGAEFDALQDSFRNAFAEIPATADSVANVMSIITRQTGATGDALEDLTKDMHAFARVTGQDAVHATSAFTTVMAAHDLSVDEARLALDQFTLASQMTGIEVDKLMGYVVESGPAFQQMGFGLTEQIALFGQFAAAGARPEELLSSMNLLLNNFAKEGATNAQQAFDMLLDEIRAAPDIFAATTIAGEYFSSRVGGKIAEDVRAGNFEISDLVDILNEADGTMWDTANAVDGFSESWQLFKNNLQLAVEPVAARVFAMMSDFMDWMNATAIPVMYRLGDALNDRVAPAFNYLRSAASDVWSVFEKNVVPALSTVASIISDTLGPIVQRVGRFLDDHREIWIGIAAAIGVLAVPALVSVIGAIAGVVGAIALAAAPVTGLALAFAGISLAVGYVIRNWDDLVEKWPWLQDVLDTALGVVDSLKEGFFRLVDGARGVIDDVLEPLGGVGGALDELGSIINGAWNNDAEALRESFERMPGPISNASDELVAFTDHMHTGVGMIQEAIGGLYEWAVGAITGIIGWFRNLGDANDETSIRIMNLWNQMKETASAVWSFIREFIEVAIIAIGAVITVTLTAIRWAWDRWGEGLQERAGEIFNAIITFIEGVFKIIEGIFVIGAAILQGEWGDAWEGIKTIVSGAGISVEAIIDGLMSAIGGIVDIGMDIAKTLFWEALDIIEGYWEDLKEGVITKTEETIEWVKEVPGKILDALGDLGMLLFEAGKDIMRGLRDGMRDMAPDVLLEAVEIGENIYNRVTGFFGVRSPSTLMKQVGRDIGAGFAVGIRDSSANVVHAMSDMNQDVLSVADDMIADLEKRIEFGQKIIGMEDTSKSLTASWNESIKIAERGIDRLNAAYAARERIEQNFLDQRVDAYLQGGLEAARVVAMTQGHMRDEITRVARDLQVTFGLDVPTSLDVAARHAQQYADNIVRFEQELAASRLRVEQGFQDELIDVYLKGGLEAAAAAWQGQQQIRDEIETVAEEIATVFGVELPTAIDIAARHVQESAQAVIRAEEELSAARLRVEDHFVSEQVDAWLRGGESLLRVVEQTQDYTREEIERTAEMIANRFGVDMPEAMAIAMNHIIGSIDEVQRAAEALEQDLIRARERIERDFLNEQVQAYLEGGQRALDEVKRSQGQISNEVESIANDLVQTFGVDLPTALDMAFRFIQDRMRELERAAREAERTGGTSSNVRSFPLAGSFGGGGIVPGPIGSPQLIRAHGGETVLPTHKGTQQVTIPVYIGSHHIDDIVFDGIVGNVRTGRIRSEVVS